MTDTTPSPAPLRFALVPIDSTVYMDAAGRRALSDNGCEHVRDIDAEKCYRAMTAAGPSNDLMQRIVRARDNLQSVRNWPGVEACDVMDAVNSLADVLNELGGEQ